MDTFEPMLNFLVVQTVLSVASERITNLIKLKNPDLSDHTAAKSMARSFVKRDSVSCSNTTAGTRRS